MSRHSLPVVDPANIPDEPSRGDATVRSVVLAAGTSSRFGDENKLLTTVDGTPLVRRVVSTLLGSNVDGVTVVVGYESKRVRESIADLPVGIRENPAYDDGQSTSVREGVRAAKAHGADAVLVALGDMPAVDETTVDLLVTAYERGVGAIVAAAAGGKRGNPVLFDDEYFGALADTTGDIGGRRLLAESDDAVAIETGDPDVLQDINQPTDLKDIR